MISKNCFVVFKISPFNRYYNIPCFMAPERQVCREKVGEMLGEKVMYIAETLNRHEYVPKMPNQSELDLVFDTTFSDVQPYLYKVCRLKTYFSQIFSPLCHQYTNKEATKTTYLCHQPFYLSFAIFLELYFFPWIVHFF